MKLHKSQVPKSNPTALGSLVAQRRKFSAPRNRCFKSFCFVSFRFNNSFRTLKPCGRTAPQRASPTSLRRDEVAFDELRVCTERSSSCCCRCLTVSLSKLTPVGVPSLRSRNSIGQPRSLRRAPAEVAERRLTLGGFFKKRREEVKCFKLPRPPPAAGGPRISAAEAVQERSGAETNKKNPSPPPSNKKRKKGERERKRSPVPLDSNV